MVRDASRTPSEPHVLNRQPKQRMGTDAQCAYCDLVAKGQIFG